LADQIVNLAKKSHDILQLRTILFLNRTSFNLDGSLVTCTRATPRLNVRQTNHLTEKASSSIRSWAVPS